jgi:enoyl-CoA hydratase
MRAEPVEESMSSVRYERQGAVVVLWFDDGKVNTFHDGSITELREALDRAEADPEAHAVVIIGRPGCFSAGLDLKRLPLLEREVLTRVVKEYGELMIRLFGFAKPTVGVVTGHALAGGCVMLCALDKRIGAAGPFRIGLNEVAIGIPLPLFVVEIARHVLTAKATSDALLGGRVYDPEAARTAGYLDEICSPEDAPERGIALATELAALSPTAYGTTKRNLKGGAHARALAALANDIAELTRVGQFG